RRNQNVASIKLLLAGSCAYRDPPFLSRSAVNAAHLRREQKLDALVAEDSLHLICDVGVLSAHQLGPRLDDGYTAAEAPVGLRHFEADIAAPEDDQVCGQVIELERLNMGERLAGLETGNGRDCCVRSKVEKNPIAAQKTPPVIIKLHLKRFRRHKAAGPDDQFSAGRFVILQMR